MTKNASIRAAQIGGLLVVLCDTVAERGCLQGAPTLEGLDWSLPGIYDVMSGSLGLLSAMPRLANTSLLPTEPSSLPLWLEFQASYFSRSGLWGMLAGCTQLVAQRNDPDAQSSKAIKRAFEPGRGWNVLSIDFICPGPHSS
ncbi:hypothetical protein AYO22_04890 [Fonsecaea multimorphosa]|nr:hypothetical protein AYO22_04890 [Fonsecaea multimorphosa]